jgi:hypothetical protein
MLKREQLADGGWLLTQAAAQVYFIVPKPAVIVIAASGPGDTALDEAVLDMLEREIRRSGPLTIFADVSQQTRMAPETREKASAWAKEHRKHVHATHILVRSKLVEMAFSVLGMLVNGRFKIYSKTHEYHAALQADVPTFKAHSFSGLQAPGVTAKK